jgi:uncharacterized protein
MDPKVVIPQEIIDLNAELKAIYTQLNPAEQVEFLVICPGCRDKGSCNRVAYKAYKISIELMEKLSAAGLPIMDLSNL